MAICRDKSKYAMSMMTGKSNMPSTDTKKRYDFNHCSFFFLSKNTHPVILYSNVFSKK